MTQAWNIIIPVYNPPTSLLENLSKLNVVCPVAISRIILVDDGSSNDVPRQAQLRFPSLTYLKGDGNLWWCGAMKLGMVHALEKGAKVILWLNHDCVPEANTLERLVDVALEDGMGAVSAWCHSIDAPEFPVNPGFRRLRPIPLDELRTSERVVVDGLNGNCVAINTTAIRSVGLPDSIKHPHYGDGPYTYLLHKSGFKNLVLTTANALLEREYDRCVSIKWRCAFWNKPLSTKLHYYFLSNKSQYHWKIKYHDAVAFRGYPMAPFAYIGSILKVFTQIISGHHLRLTMGRDSRLEAVCHEYDGSLPKEAIIESLIKLEND
jgi:GT2 family glycosyltransferase